MLLPVDNKDSGLSVNHYLWLQGSSDMTLVFSYCRRVGPRGLIAFCCCCDFKFLCTLWYTAQYLCGMEPGVMGEIKICGGGGEE